MNIILYGLPMSGKTTTGRMIAEKLKRSFIDTDRLVEQAYEMQAGKKCNCRQIYKNEGELTFRSLEKQQISSLTSQGKSVVAVGGGSLCDQENVKRLQSIGRLIYLKASKEILWQRIQHQGTPAYLEEDNPKTSFEELVKKRIPLYEKMADVIIETDEKSEQDVAAILLRAIESFKNIT